jgi:hypothetical protein
MSTYGFGRVETDGFLGMIAVLREGAWGNIALPSATAPRPVWNLLSQEVRAKVRLSEALDAVAPGGRRRRPRPSNSIRPGTVCNVVLDGMLTADTYHDDPDRQAAAQRLRKLLTLGNGTGQTGLSFQAEVDFGNRQADCSSATSAPPTWPCWGTVRCLSPSTPATQALARVLGRATTASDARCAVERVQRRAERAACRPSTSPWPSSTKVLAPA